MTDPTPQSKPQIDPTTAQDLARLLLDLSHNKDTRKEIGKLVKKAKPDSPHAAAFSDVEIEDKFEAFQRKQEEKEIENQQKQVLARMNAQRARLLSGGDDGEGPKYSEDDVKKIEDLMQKKGITDYEDGRILYASTLPPTSTKPTDLPPNISGSTWEFPDWAKFGKDEKRASREIANEVIGEFMRKRA